jgi:hypothetical protein
MSKINRAAVKRFALQCSKERRAGKFQRVSQEFLDRVEAEVESAIRKVNGNVNFGEVAGQPLLCSDETFLTPSAVEDLTNRINQVTLRIVQAAVQQHPTKGKTLL